MEELVAAADDYRKILSALLPAGALGMSLFLGAGPADAARELPAAGLASPTPVGERLSAIRDAVSAVAGATPAAEQLAWHNWANFGTGGPWNNWRNGWNNWRNNWHNGWNNWGNGWNNWKNGWLNW